MEHNGVDAHVVPGRPGEFTVLVDGEEVWNKKASGRFPEHDEVLRLLV